MFALYSQPSDLAVGALPKNPTPLPPKGGALRSGGENDREKELDPSFKYLLQSFIVVITNLTNMVQCFLLTSM